MLLINIFTLLFLICVLTPLYFFILLYTYSVCRWFSPILPNTYSGRRRFSPILLYTYSVCRWFLSILLYTYSGCRWFSPILPYTYSVCRWFLPILQCRCRRTSLQDQHSVHHYARVRFTFI